MGISAFIPDMRVRISHSVRKVNDMQSEIYFVVLDGICYQEILPDLAHIFPTSIGVTNGLNPAWTPRFFR